MTPQPGKIIIENLFGGWADTFQGGPVVVEGEDNQYTKGANMALNRPGFEGHLAPGYTLTALTDASTNVTALPLNGVVDSAGNTTVVLANGRVVNFPIVSQIISTTDAHTPTGAAASVYSDIVIYPKASTSNPPSTTGVDEYVFWSYETSTYGDVALRKKSSGVYTDAYLTTLGTQTNGTALVVSVPHPMLVGQDNNLYIGNGRFLASHDPTTAIVNYQALDLKPGWTVSALSNYQNYIAILAYKASIDGSGFSKSEAKMFLWDGFSPSWNFEYYVRDNYASNILYDGTELFVISQGRNQTTKLKHFNGSGFDTWFENSTGAIFNSPYIGGSDLFLNHIFWTPQAGNGLNCYGSPSEKYPKGFHRVEANAAGMVKNLGTNQLFVGSNTSGFTINVVNLNGYAANNTATWTSKLYKLPTNSTVTAIKFYHSQFGNNAQYVAAFGRDYETVAFSGDQLIANVTGTTTTTTYYAQASKTYDNVNSFRIQLSWTHANATDTAAIIRRIEVDYNQDEGNI
jgi:hypothetical protein